MVDIISTPKERGQAMGLITIEAVEEETPEAVAEPLPIAEPAPVGIPAEAPVADEKLLAAESEAEAVATKKKRRFNAIGKAVPAALLGFAVVSSSASMIGLIMASRSISKANLLIDDAEARENKLHEIEDLARQIRAASARQQAAMGRVDEMIAIAKPATVQDMRNQMNDFQVAMAKAMPVTNGTMARLVGSEAELANRISVLYTKVDRIERALIASPRGIRADDQAPTS